jgi:hypothetical protein
VLFALLGLALATTVPARGPADKDLAEIREYRLGESALAKYIVAVQSLNRLSAGLPSLDDDVESGGKSLDEHVAVLDAKPEAKQAIRSAGLTTREFVVFTWSLYEAGMASWALTQPGGKLPPGVSMDNVDFVRQHEAELKLLEKEDGGDDTPPDTEDED